MLTIPQGMEDEIKKSVYILREFTADAKKGIQYYFDTLHNFQNYGLFSWTYNFIMPASTVCTRIVIASPEK